MKMYIFILSFPVILAILFFSMKLVMQRAITRNYLAREAGLLPDKWYWVDRVYYRVYGDYSFYEGWCKK